MDLCERIAVEALINLTEPHVYGRVSKVKRNRDACNYHHKRHKRCPVECPLRKPKKYYPPLNQVTVSGV